MIRRTILLAACLLLAAWGGVQAETAADEEDGPVGVEQQPAEDGDSPAVTKGSTAVDPDAGIEVAAAAGTVTEALQGKDGLRIQTMCTHCNSANIQVGGLSKEYAPITRNEYPVIGGLATSLVMSILPSDTIADAKVFKGPGAAREPGPVAGGAIRLTESTPLEVPRLDVAVEGGSYDMLGGTVRAGGRLGERVSGLIVAGTQNADSVDDDGDGWNDVPAVDRQFAEGRLDLEAGENHDLDFGASWIQEDDTDGRGAYDVLADVSTPEDDSPIWTREDTLFERFELRAGWRWSLGRGRELEARLLAATRDQKVLSQLTSLEEFFGQPNANRLFDRFNITEDNRWGTVHYRHPIGLDWMARFGIEFEEQEVYAATFDAIQLLLGRQTEPDEIVETVRSSSAYADVEWNPSARWKVQFGLRYEDADWLTHDITLDLRTERDRSRTLPRVTVRFAPSPGWTLKLIAGSTFRPPRPILSEVCCGQRYQVVSNTYSEDGMTVGFEGVFQPSPTLRASIYAARSEFDEHILRMVGWSQFYTQTYALANVPEARADTAEVAVRWSPHHRVDLDASYGWLSFHNTGDEIVDVLVTPPSFTTPQVVPIPIDRIPYLPERTGSAGITLNLPRGTSVNLQAAYTGEMMIQHWERGGLLDEMIRTPDFWMLNLGFEVPVGKGIDIVGALSNLTDYIQDDLGDPTTDYNWGPLAGRSWRLGARFRLGR